MCEHPNWIKQESLEGCGICQGDSGPVDGLLILDKTKTPTLGDVCSDCFQIFGKAEGIKHQGLINFERVQRQFN